VGHRSTSIKEYEPTPRYIVQVVSDDWQQGYEIIADSPTAAMESVELDHLSVLHKAGVIKGKTTLHCGGKSVPFNPKKESAPCRRQSSKSTAENAPAR